ncbi:MAG: STAS domain-containing protein [Oscillospiraceae bacterium]|nr:STAS domain-containing protein [Oscillospiraceae bacterium]
MKLTKTIADDSILFLEGTKVVMRIKEELVGDSVRITLQGELRSELFQHFQDELLALISVGKDLELNCRGLEYVAPSCVGVLVQVEQTVEQSGRTMKLVELPSAVNEEFEKTGAADLLLIE